MEILTFQFQQKLANEIFDVLQVFEKFKLYSLSSITIKIKILKFNIFYMMGEIISFVMNR